MCTSAAIDSFACKVFWVGGRRAACLHACVRQCVRVWAGGTLRGLSSIGTKCDLINFKCWAWLGRCNHHVI